MRIIDKILMWLDNKYEDYTHYVFNKKPHYVRCGICDEILSSKNGDTPSPEECGWREFKTGGWVCHRCDAHRYLKPYVEILDLDEEIKWRKWREENVEELLEERNLIFEKATKDLLSK